MISIIQNWRKPKEIKMLTQRDLCKMQNIPSNVSPIPMTLNEIQALTEEFPGIKLYMGESITKIYTSKVESALLDYSLATGGKLPGYYGPEWIQEGIYFLDKKGEEVTSEINVQRRKFFFFNPIWKTKKVFGRVFGFKHSSVRTAVNRLCTRADSIRLLVSVYEYTGSLIIYRLPKDVSMRQIIREAVTTT